MAGAGDLKVYKTTDHLGGAITGTQIFNATPNNLFQNVTRAEQLAGTDEYKCCFFKNTSAESMDNFKIWLTHKRLPNDTSIMWGYDSVARKTVGFDGVNDYIDCGNHADLWSQALTKFSFSFWIYPTAGWDGNVRHVVNHGGTAAQGFRCTIDDDQPGGITFRVRNAADTEFRADNFNLNLNRLNHIVCVYDSTLGSANLKIYVNKIPQNITATLTQTINQSAILTLADSTTDFKGYMKDFRWYTGIAVNQAQVNAEYDGASNAPVPDYWLKLNDLSGNPTDVKSGNKEATLTNGATWNFDAQTIPGTHTEPSDINWTPLSNELGIAIRRFGPGQFVPIWLHYHVEPGAASRLDDSELFAFKFSITQGGSGSGGTDVDPDPVGGGGTGGGGNPPPPSTNYKIAVAGDWGCESATDDVIDLIQGGGYNLLVGVGDNAYDSASCWVNRMNAIKSIFQISAYGNHEYSESGGTSPYKTFFGDSKTYYTFKFQNIFFMIIDSNIDMDSGSTQHTFIKNALLNSLNDNTITWRIGVIHHPWFGADSDHSYNDGNSVQAFHQLFQDNEVQFVFAGHNHNWQRSHQVAYNSGNPESPNVVDNTSPYSATKKGIIHVISGTGGHDSGSSLYDLGGQPGFQAYQNRSHNGIFELVASNNGQTLTGAFVSIDGDKFGSFTITAT